MGCADVSGMDGGSIILKQRIMIVSNTAWSLVNFRAGLIRALVNAGYEVVAVAPSDEYCVRLPDLGCRYVSLPMDNKGTHPGRDLLLLWQFYLLIRKERPNIYLGFTIKPNIYGSLAARLLRIPVINNITGLGSAFTEESWLSRLVKGLYRLALSRSIRIFFQNNDDRQLFLKMGLVCEEVTDRLPGSGVDLAYFTHTPKITSTSAKENFRFLLIARMLWDKGVREYVEAARLLLQSNPHAEFCLVGFVDVQNPAAVSSEQMDEWVAEGVVNYLGVSDDVRDEILAADCVVLPSYYPEGVPRSLLESAAMARPIITTDSVGCREVVDDGSNGFLCEPRDAEDLAAKMEQMMNLSAKERFQMGKNGRAKMEQEFDELIVIERYFKVIKDNI